uniref:HORMA domain-containing protein n=1 Tax=Myotis lucifugus TaxID=59463 RepID=G1NZL1_MYOLU
GIILCWSADIGPEFFSLGIHSILHQGGIYPSETFTRVQKCGLTLLVTTDPELMKYLSNVMTMTVHLEKSLRKLSKMKSAGRQITATVTFLSLLEVSHSFDLLLYTDKVLVVSEKWESGPEFIINSEQVHLRYFTATIHKVNSIMADKIPVRD